LGDEAMTRTPDLTRERRSHIIDVPTAAALVSDGMTIGLGGFINTGHSMVVVRQLIRDGRRDLTVVGAASAGLEIDMLVAAGAVRKVIAPYVGAEGIAGIGPAFRHAAERGEIDVFELDEAHHYAGLRAAAQRLPFNPWRAGVGTSLPVVNPDLRQFRDPINGELLIAVPAIEMDVCFIHAAASDRFGNVRHNGTGYGDAAMAAAAETVVASVEKVVPVEQTRAMPASTSIPGADHVVRAQFGSHPFGADGYYRPDDEHLRGYVAAATDMLNSGSRGRLDDYLHRFVIEPPDHAEYLARVGIRRLLELHEY
jgi:glutaconate CoA-transferase subunit A